MPLTARILDGKVIAATIRAEVKRDAAWCIVAGVTPCLGVALIGDNAASHAYVGMKEKACAEAGIRTITERRDRNASAEEVLAIVRGFNADPAVHGILVQLPLPPQVPEREILNALDPAKDVDGLHPANMGRLLAGDADGFVPCTPAGVLQILKRGGIPTAGAHVVVVGRSNIVGKPLAVLLSQKAAHGDATVTLCHSRTPDLAAHTRRADILIAAMGQPRSITADMIKPDATVIDVGTSRVDDPSAPKGYRLAGDVDFDAAIHVASAITPVPGGVGPLTIAMLLRNTVMAAERQTLIRQGKM